MAGVPPIAEQDLETSSLRATAIATHFDLAVAHAVMVTAILATAWARILLSKIRVLEEVLQFAEVVRDA